MNDVPAVPPVVTLELAGIRPSRPDEWLPEVVYRELPEVVYRELSRPSYPPGAYPLYRLLRQAAEGRGGLSLPAMVARWRAEPSQPDSVPCLRSVRAIAESAHALARHGFLQRESTGDGEHWTILAPDQPTD